MPLSEAELALLREMDQPGFVMTGRSVADFVDFSDNPEFVVAVTKSANAYKVVLGLVTLEDITDRYKVTYAALASISREALGPKPATPPPLPPSSLSPQQSIGAEIRAICLKLESNQGDLKENLETLRNLHARALNLNARIMVNHINDFLKNHKVLQDAYHQHVQQARRPIAPGGDAIGAGGVKKQTTHYLHKKINFSDLNPQNGKLFSDEEIVEIKRLMQGKQSITYKNREVIKLLDKTGNEVICAQYAELGKGNFGAVSLGQDLVSGEWIALKDQRKDNPKSGKTRGDNIAAIGKEINALHSANKYRGEASIGDPPNDRIVFGQQLAEGIELFDAIETPDIFVNTINLPGWLNFAGDLLMAYKQQVAEVGDEGYVNRDLKPENTIINYITGEVFFIDSGMAAPKNGGVVKDDSAMGSPHYIAPEVLTRDSNGKVIYNEKTEVFALGMMLLHFYQFPISFYEVTNIADRMFGVEIYEFDENSPAMKRFPNPIVRDAMLSLFKQMVAVDPDDRPTVDECLERLAVIRDLSLLSRNIMKNIAIFDIDEYRRITDPAQKVAIHAELLNADEVWILDSGKSKTVYEQLSVINELQKAGVRVGKTFYSQPDGNLVTTQLSLIKSAQEDIRKSHPDDVLALRFVSSETASPMFVSELAKVGVRHAAQVDPALAGKAYAKPMAITPLTIDQRSIVIKSLEDDMERLHAKYRGRDKEVVARIEEIKKVADALRKSPADELSHEGVLKTLTDLQEKMYSTNVFRSVLKMVDFESESAKNIQSIRNVLSPLPPQNKAR